MLTAKEHKEFFIEEPDGSRVGISLTLTDNSPAREKFLEAYNLLLEAMEEWEDIHAADVAHALGEVAVPYDNNDVKTEIGQSNKQPAEVG